MLIQICWVCKAFLDLLFEVLGKIKNVKFVNIFEIYDFSKVNFLKIFLGLQLQYMEVSRLGTERAAAASLHHSHSNARSNERRRRGEGREEKEKDKIFVFQRYLKYYLFTISCFGNIYSPNIFQAPKCQVLRSILKIQPYVTQA